MNTEDNYDRASSAGFNFGGHAGGCGEGSGDVGAVGEEGGFNFGGHAGGGGEDSGDGGAIRKEGGGMACGRISGVAETLSPLGTDNVAGLEDNCISTTEPGDDLLFPIQAEDDLASLKVSKNKHHGPTFFRIPGIFVPAAPPIDDDAESGMEGGAHCANGLDIKLAHMESGAKALNTSIPSTKFAHPLTSEAEGVERRRKNHGVLNTAALQNEGVIGGCQIGRSIEERVWAETLDNASTPYRVDADGNIIAFHLGTDRDAAETPSFSTGEISTERMRIFLAKYLALCWLFTLKGRKEFGVLPFRRLVRYLRYYQAILGDLRSSQSASFEFWWHNESHMAHMQHSSAREPRSEGPLTVEGVTEENDIEWELNVLLAQDNFALVSQADLNQTAGFVEDWIEAEVDRELGPDREAMEEMVTDDLYGSSDYDSDEGSEDDQVAPEEHLGASAPTPATGVTSAGRSPTSATVAGASPSAGTSLGVVPVDVPMMQEEGGEGDDEADPAVALPRAPDEEPMQDEGSEGDDEEEPVAPAPKPKKKAARPAKGGKGKGKGSKPAKPKAPAKAFKDQGTGYVPTGDHKAILAFEKLAQRDHDHTHHRLNAPTPRENKWHPLLPTFLPLWNARCPKIQVSDDPKSIPKVVFTQMPSVRRVDLRQMLQHRKMTDEFELSKMPYLRSKHTPTVSSSETEDKPLSDIKKRLWDRRKPSLPKLQNNPILPRRKVNKDSLSKENIPRGRGDVMRTIPDVSLPPDEMPEENPLPHIDDDEVEMLEEDHVENMLSQTTPPPLGERSDSPDTDRALRELATYDREIALDRMDDMFAHVALPQIDSLPDGSAVASSSVGDTEVDELDDDGESEVDDGDAEWEEAPVPLQRTRQNPTRAVRGRPQGVKNKPKKKSTPPARPNRRGQKRTREAVSPSPTREDFDMPTPIVVQVHKNISKPTPSPSKKARKAVSPARRDSKPLKMGTRERSRVILTHLRADLREFLYHLNNPKIKKAEGDKFFADWLDEVIEVLQRADVDKPTVLGTHLQLFSKVALKIEERRPDDPLVIKFATIVSFLGNIEKFQGEDGTSLEIRVGDSVFIQPPPGVYNHDAQYKKRRKIPGHLYWQGKIIHLGQRKEELGSDDGEDDETVPPAAVVIEWYYTYYDVKDTRASLIKSLGMGNVGHLERLHSNHKQVIFPDAIEDVFHPKVFQDTTVSMPLMDRDDYFVRQGKLIWDKGKVVLRRNGSICHEDCIKDSVYDPSDVDCELRWCGPCHRWFHSSCVEVENTLELGEDDDQLYLLEKGTDLFSRLISRPVRRYSRKHGAPLSLEKIQTHLISKWRLLKGGVYDAERLSHDVEECDLFAGG
ncbi:hypothetical protein BJ912DRAFT_932123 [Pholiota molesta]|nr:hypothetical protein BJ912DRAFT_932123 [Pholiota molesta]